MIDRVNPILVVEDEPDDISFILRATSRANIVNPLVIKATAAEARAYVQSLHHDVLPVLCVVDVYLPNGESGLDFLAWLRRQPPPLGELPSMIFTVSNSPTHKVEASALRSVLFLSKPATEETFTNAVLALGFVITSTAVGGGTRRLIERRS